MEVKDWLILGLLVIAFLVWWFRRNFRRISGKKPGRSNTRTVQFLQDAGYDVLKAKPIIRVKMEIDGKPHPFELKADYLVSKSGRRYLVRVRRDNKAVRLQSKMWRNSLLRDVLAYRAGGILIVNVEKETLHEVRFRI
ncbi:MAG: hypothetical protein SCK29_03485 [Bacillota bacterium]|nr:hypothetical protein [Bacillota bacterium]